MGADPKTSVTDAYGRFHKAPMLLCADAASFPRIGATNPHLTIVAMARRQAAKLAASLA
jgi:choline dehydrogenase-like flavoprotein